MDKIITKHLKNLVLKPRSDEFFQEVAEDMTGNKVQAKKAKIIVRKKISEGQVEASNDNVEGLKKQVVDEQKQVVDEQNGGGTENFRRQAKAYLFNKSSFDEKKAEEYLDKRDIQYGKPRNFRDKILIPLANISKNDKLGTKEVDSHVHILHTL